MAEIQGAVVAADINDDGKIELVTTDTHGNVAAWTPQGVEIWETHLKSLVPQVHCSFHFILSCVGMGTACHIWGTRSFAL